MTPTGSASEHLSHRSSLALAAWRILNEQFGFSKLSFRTRSRIYKTILSPILLHGCLAYPINVTDMRVIQKTQNIIQRTFVRIASGEQIHDRWLELHRRLHQHRSQGRLEDSVNRLQQMFVSAKFPPQVMKVLQYRSTVWHSKPQPGRP